MVRIGRPVFFPNGRLRLGLLLLPFLFLLPLELFLLLRVFLHQRLRLLLVLLFQLLLRNLFFGGFPGRRVGELLVLKLLLLLHVLPLLLLLSAQLLLLLQVLPLERGVRDAGRWGLEGRRGLIRVRGNSRRPRRLRVRTRRSVGRPCDGR